MSDAFRKWLCSKDGEALLKDRSDKKRQRDKADDRSDVELEGKSDWEILLECGAKPRAALNALVIREDWEGLRRKILSMLASARAEEKRNKLYERVRQVLSKADGSYGYQAGEKYSSYGAAQNGASTVGSWDELKASGFSPIWPLLELNGVRSRSGVLELADSLRRQLQDLRGVDCRIPLSTLCGFIGAKFPIEQIYPSKAGLEKKNVINREETSRDLVEDDIFYFSKESLQHPSALLCSDEQLEKIADTVAYQLEKAELLLVVCLVVYCELKLAQAARALGYAGPSGASARLRSAQNMIKQLASLHEGLGGDDLDEDLFKRFLGVLLSHCKDGDCSRYAQ